MVVNFDLKSFEREEKLRLVKLEKEYQELKDKKEKLYKQIWKLKNKKLNRISKNRSYQNNKKKIIKSMKKYNQINRPKERKKYNARAIASRKIVLNGKCEICKKNKATDRHHRDYNKPLEVIKCCKLCHAKLDRI